MKSLCIMIAVVAFASLLSAQPQQSTDFRITKSVVDAGGTLSTSADFRLTSAFGQPSPLGPQQSADFVLYPGFLSPAAISPLSPIQALVILTEQPDILLAWERIASAHSYKIYRSDDPEFTAAPGNYLTAVADTFFVDEDIITQPPVRYYYIIAASSDFAPPVMQASMKAPALTTKIANAPKTAVKVENKIARPAPDKNPQTVHDKK
jgi:hypothetical protein